MGDCPKVSKNTICAGGDDKGACFGDSGGPLICLDEDKQPILTGVVSGGNQCGKPSFYVDVASINDWIKETTAPFYCTAGERSWYDGEMFASKPCEVPTSECPVAGSMGPWTGNIAKVMYKSNTAMMIRIHLSLNIYPFAREGES